MADDIKINLGLDASQLFNDLDAALKKVNENIKGLPDVGDAIASDLPSAQNKLNSFVNEQKQLLVSLRLQGKEGSESYAEIEKAIKEANVELKKMDDATKAVNDSFKEVEGSAGGISGVFEGLKGGLNDAFSGGLIGGLVGGGLAGAVQTGIGAIVDGFGSVVDAGRGLISAQGDLQAQTGATGAELEGLKKAAEDAFLGGVGESVAEATKVISNAKVVLKDALPTDQIGEFVKGAQALGSLYDKDVNEVIAKSTPFIKQFGLDGKEAFDLVAFAAKEGKTSQDDVLDTLAEYSQLLSEAGFSAEEFAGQMAIAGQEGLFNTDKIADSIKEAQIRLKAGDTAKAFAEIKTQLPQALGSTLGNLEQLASSGQITIKDFLSKSGEAIKTAFDSGQISEAMASQLQVAVAGTPAEDIGVEAYNKMFGAPIPVEEIKKKAAQAGQDAMNAAGQYLSFDMVSRNLELAFEKGSAVVVKGASDAFGMIATAVGPAFSELGATLSGVFERIWTVIGPIIMGIGAAIMTNIVASFNIAITVVTTVLDIFTSIFDSIASSLKPLTDIFLQTFGLNGALGQGKTVVQSFQEALNFVGEVIREVGGIVADIGGLIIEFLITPFQTLIEVIADVTRSISGWISTNDSSTESMKESGKAAQNSKGFIDTLRQAFDNIRGTIGGVRESFIQIKTTIGEFWDAITQLDIQKALSAFTGFGEKLNAAYDKGFNKTKETIKATADAQKNAVEDSKKTGLENIKLIELTEEEKKKLEDEKKKKKGAQTAKDQASELQLLRESYKDKQEAQKNDIERELADEKNKYADKKVLRAKLEAEANTELRKFLNERIGGINDANAFLDESQLTVKIKPSKKKNETVEDINTFYTQEIVKLRKGLEVETKYKIDIPTFKEQLKEVETISKDFAATAEKLVPITISGSSEELAQVQQDVLNFQEFLKAQNLEIAQLQQEAQIAGNEEAAQKFAEAINKNVQSINLLESRVKTFAEKTQEEQKKNTFEYQIANALQTSFLDVFNSEKIRKERETNETIRKERLGALDAEENDLNKSLAKREISAEEYAAKLAEINNGRQKAQEETEVTVLQKLKQAGDKVVGDVLKTQGAAFTEQAKKMEGGSKIMYEAMGGLATSFGALAASGKATLKDFAGASIDIAVQAMMKMIPIWTAEIFATSVAELGVGGLAVAAGLQIVLMGLVSAARSAGGFKDGVVGLDGAGTETSDSIPAWLSRGESVITAKATRNNKEELEFMNRTGLSIAEFYRMRMPSTSVSVTPDGDLIREVRKLREETRGLGARIQRNTSVEVSGVLTADSKSINALIVEQKRRSARRG